MLKPSGGVTLPDGGAGLTVDEAEKQRAVARFLGADAGRPSAGARAARPSRAVAILALELGADLPRPVDVWTLA